MCGSSNSTIRESHCDPEGVDVSKKHYLPREVVLGAERKLRHLAATTDRRFLSSTNGNASLAKSLLSQTGGDVVLAKSFVRAALQRIKEGTFGICIYGDDHHLIPPAVIRERPWDPCCSATCRRKGAAEVARSYIV